MMKCEKVPYQDLGYSIVTPCGVNISNENKPQIEVTSIRFIPFINM